MPMSMIATVPVDNRIQSNFLTRNIASRELIAAAAIITPARISSRLSTSCKSSAAAPINRGSSRKTTGSYDAQQNAGGHGSS